MEESLGTTFLQLQLEISSCLFKESVSYPLLLSALHLNAWMLVSAGFVF